MDYLIMKKPKWGRFYLLLKIHKYRSNVPGHPVISNNDTATENISSFLDFHLKTIIPTIPHILEHSSDFSSWLNQLCDIPNNTILVTFDVLGLYPHIPHNKGLETMKRYGDKREDQSVFSDSLYKLAKIILKHNYFELGQDAYYQILGTAIDRKFAPHYTNICMAVLKNIFSNTQIQPLLWLQYLDDIFCSWTDTIEKLKEFLEFLNVFTLQ